MKKNQRLTIKQTEKYWILIKKLQQLDRQDKKQFSSFLQSVLNFLNVSGHLTDKQINTLYYIEAHLHTRIAQENGADISDLY